MQIHEHRGYQIRIEVQPRGEHACFVMTDITKGPCSWARYHDAPVLGTRDAVEAAALAEAIASVERQLDEPAPVNGRRHPTRRARTRSHPRR